MSSGGLKQCSSCLRDLSESAYSGAQLKRKGKRVCKTCVNKQGGGSGGGSENGAASEIVPGFAEQQLAALVAAHSSLNGVPPPLTAPVTAVDAPLLPDPAPPNSFFPGQRAALWDAARSIGFYAYSSESRQLSLLQRLIESDLSEPYSVFTYRYFLNFWPHLTFLAMQGDECVGCVVGRVTLDKAGRQRGYIAMLAVSPAYRGAGLGTTLVQLALDAMRAQGAALCILEAEVTNRGALALYEKLNFVRETRLVKYYLSGSDAFRLKLWLQPPGMTIRPPVGFNPAHGTEDDE